MYLYLLFSDFPVISEAGTGGGLRETPSRGEGGAGTGDWDHRRPPARPDEPKSVTAKIGYMKTGFSEEFAIYVGKGQPDDRPTD